MAKGIVVDGTTGKPHIGCRQGGASDIGGHETGIHGFFQIEDSWIKATNDAETEKTQSKEKFLSENKDFDVTEGGEYSLLAGIDDIETADEAGNE